ncbi:EHMT1 isoform 29 [Pongo abelii]|uniref:EHMT1 isoform 29 n=1 Tax=Pongo abelii TaxID=9601 RepID=A0A2J8RMA9_PONAB|nr:EHMT1 isoform 29 [Pongo abelii]
MAAADAERHLWLPMKAQQRNRQERPTWLRTVRPTGLVKTAMPAVMQMLQSTLRTAQGSTPRTAPTH